MPRRRAPGYETVSLRPERSQTARPSGSGSFFDSARNLAISDGQFNSVQGHHTNVVINLNQNSPAQSPSRNRTTSNNPSISSNRNTRSPLNVSSPHENNRSQTNALRERRPRVPDNLASSQLLVQQSNVIYQRHLELKGRGFPLWVPPANRNLPIQYRRTGVRIGDVGIITPDGAFSFLFNICLPHDDPVNPGILPDHFAPIFPPIEATSIDKFVVFGHGSHLASASIEKTEAGSQSSGFQFESSASEGAILTMPLGATSESLGDIAKFRRYAASNIVHWYKFVNGVLGREAKNGDIRLVVGCDKTTTWGIATFANQSQQSSCRLRFGPPIIPPSDSISSNSSPYAWEYSGVADVRAGPSPGENNGLSQVDDPGDVVYENQCLFLRTLNPTLRDDIWSDIHCDSSSVDLQLQTDVHATKDSASTASSIKSRTSATKNKSSTLSSHTSGNRRCLDPHSESQTNIVAFDGNSVIFDSDPLSTPLSHPSKALNDLLMAKVPAAHMVITHDEDWSFVASKYDTFPDPHELLEQLLVSHCICEEDGVIFLERQEAIRSGVSNAQKLVPENFGAVRALSTPQILPQKSSHKKSISSPCTAAPSSSVPDSNSPMSSAGHANTYEDFFLHAKHNLDFVSPKPSRTESLTTGTETPATYDIEHGDNTRAFSKTSRAKAKSTNKRVAELTSDEDSDSDDARAPPAKRRAIANRSYVTVARRTTDKGKGEEKASVPLGKNKGIGDVTAVDSMPAVSDTEDALNLEYGEAELIEIDEPDDSGSGFKVDSEVEDEEPMVDAAIRSSLQAASESIAGPSAASMLPAATERRLARMDGEIEFELKTPWDSLNDGFASAEGEPLVESTRPLLPFSFYSPLPFRSGLAILQQNISPGACHDSRERFPPPRCHPSTRKEILDTIMNHFTETPSSSKILHLFGSEGTGKTAIAQTIAETYKSNGTLGASFFFSRASHGRNTDKNLIPTLAYQLCVNIPGLKRFIVKAVEDDLSTFQMDVDTQIERLITNPMVQAKDEGVIHGCPYLIVVDGIDECEGMKEQGAFLRAISGAMAQHNLPLYFVITSRPETHIINWLNQDPTICSTSHHLDLDRNPTHTKRDIKMPIRDSYCSRIK